MSRITMVLGLTLVVLLGWAQAGEKKAPIDDKTFLTKAAQGGLAEIKLSDLADDRAQNEKVKEFARQMVKQHQELNNQLAIQARNLKFGVLARLDDKHQAVHDQLQQMKGADFDRRYMQQMVEDHEKAVKLYEAQSQAVGETQLKAFAARTLPTLRKHLEHARTIAEMVKAGK